MSSFIHQLFIFLLITILPFISHARESRFFGKIPSAAANDVVTFPEHPDWLPETGNIPSTAANDVVSFPKHPDWLPETGNGLYSQASAELRPSDVSEFKPQPEKYIPKNYNPESYEPEFVGEGANIGSNPNNFKTDNSLYDGPQNYHLTPEEKQAEYRNSHYKGGDGGGDLAGLNNRGGESRGEAQGMSDTRRFENGKFHYDVDAGKYGADHPYESLKNGFNRRNSYYGNDENGYEFNGGKKYVGGYEKQGEFENFDFQP